MNSYIGYFHIFLKVYQNNFTEDYVVEMKRKDSSKNSVFSDWAVRRRPYPNADVLKGKNIL